jgi:hypothetical protein
MVVAVTSRELLLAWDGETTLRSWPVVNTHAVPRCRLTTVATDGPSLSVEVGKVLHRIAMGSRSIAALHGVSADLLPWTDAATPSHTRGDATTGRATRASAPDTHLSGRSTPSRGRDG